VPVPMFVCRALGVTGPMGLDDELLFCQSRLYEL